MTESPVFDAPWQAEAFALVVALQDAGFFSAREWAETLGATIRAAEKAGGANDGSAYYRCWHAALESMLAAKGLASAVTIEARAASIARATTSAHGAPQLGPDTNQ